MKKGDGLVSIGSIEETRVTGHGCPRGEKHALGHRCQPAGFAWEYGRTTEINHKNRLRCPKRGWRVDIRSLRTPDPGWEFSSSPDCVVIPFSSGTGRSCCQE